MKKTITIDPNQLQTPLTVLYDGNYADSVHEVEFLKSKNINDGLEFIDLSKSADSAADYGVDGESAKELINICDASGKVVTGIDALYAAHAVVGLSNWFKMCRLPGFLCVGTGIAPKL